jgi:hypothetical protein
MFDPRAFDADVVAVAGLAFKLRAELFAQQRGDVVRLHRMNGRPGQGIVNHRQVGLPLEHDVGGVLALIDAPVILDAEVTVDRTAGAGQWVQFAVKPFDLQPVGQPLRSVPIGDLHEGMSISLYVMLCRRSLAASQWCPLK